jgi:hypothetical protein
LYGVYAVAGAIGCPAVSCPSRRRSLTAAFSLTGAKAQTKPSYGTVTIAVGASPSAARIGDLDGDGLNDIAVVTLQGNLQLFYGSGAGSFQQVSFAGLWPGMQALNSAIGDLNGDGKNDLAVALSTSAGAVSVLLNQGNRTFAAPFNYNAAPGRILWRSAT